MEASFLFALLMDDVVRQLPYLPLSLTLTVLLAVSGCGSWSQQVCSSSSYGQPRARIYVADGAGDFRATSATFHQLVSTDHLPLEVETVVWSHGYGRVLSDVLDHDYAQAQGQKLAERIVAQRQACPERPIFLVAHSSGAWVMLTAAATAPPGYVDGIILIAPAVPTDYDLRPALQHVCRGIDVFYSPHDRWAYSVGLLHQVVCQEGDYQAAGRYGFRTLEDASGDSYGRLHQTMWEPSMLKTGNTGGHYGGYRPGYLRAYVLPLILGKGYAHPPASGLDTANILPHPTPIQ